MGIFISILQNAALRSFALTSLTSAPLSTNANIQCKPGFSFSLALSLYLPFAHSLPLLVIVRPTFLCVPYHIPSSQLHSPLFAPFFFTSPSLSFPVLTFPPSFPLLSFNANIQCKTGFSLPLTLSLYLPPPTPPPLSSLSPTSPDPRSSHLACRSSVNILSELTARSPQVCSPTTASGRCGSP